MASVNPLSRELVFKIVYYGPGLGGKTTTLEHIHATAKPEHRGKLVSLATPVDRTLYFDFLPVRLPAVRGMNVRLQLFTVPGQVYFNATRKLVLTGADGIVFVSDSQFARADANLESLENLRENLTDQGRELSELPLVFQHNKRDLPDLLPVEELDSMLNLFRAPSFATSATTGLGIYEALEKISSLVLASFEEKLPDTQEAGAAPGFEAIEGGLITALRDVTQQPAAPSHVVVAHIRAPDAHPAFPLEGIESSTPLDAAPSAPPDAAPSAPPAAVSSTSPEASSSVPDPRSLSEPIPLVSRAAREAQAPTASVPITIGPQAPTYPAGLAGDPAQPSGVSFAELWPEGEQETVREIERTISAGRYWRAIELCEALVSRVFAAAALLFGTTDAPRDASVVPLLLGLDGRRYLTFRSIVREARGDGLITAREALYAYAFAIDVRIARSSIHHAAAP